MPGRSGGPKPGLRFNTRVKLDPSQVEGLSNASLRRARKRRLYEEGLNQFPFLTPTQRLQMTAEWGGSGSSSIPAWFRDAVKKSDKRKRRA